MPVHVSPKPIFKRMKEGILRTFVMNDSRAQLSTMGQVSRPQQMFSGGVSFGDLVRACLFAGRWELRASTLSVCRSPKAVFDVSMRILPCLLWLLNSAGGSTAPDRASSGAK